VVKDNLTKCVILARVMIRTFIRSVLVKLMTRQLIPTQANRRTRLGMSLPPTVTAEGLRNCTRAYPLRWRQHIACPRCKLEFPITETLAQPLPMLHAGAVHAEIRRVFPLLLVLVQLNLRFDVLRDGGLGHSATNISVPIVQHMPVARPPAAEQRAIVEYLDGETAKIDALIAKVESAIANLQEYCDSLVTSAVTGKIDVLGETVGGRARWRWRWHWERRCSIL
jgi:hypothetical protein